MRRSLISSFRPPALGAGVAASGCGGRPAATTPAGHGHGKYLRKDAYWSAPAR
jgi:hypothetical protein